MTMDNRNEVRERFGRSAADYATSEVHARGESLGLLVDMICFLSNLDCENRQSILELADVEKRCGELIRMLRTDPGDQDAQDDFPPKFSIN